MTVLRTAYVNVLPKTDNFDAELKRRLQRIDASKEGHRAGGTFGAGLTRGFSDRAGVFSKVVAIAAARATLMGSAAASAAPGVLQLTAALVPAAGAAIALPAGLLAIQAASATVKVAVMGVGSAIKSGFGDNAKKAEKDLAKLTGEARFFATEVIRLKPQLAGLQQTIANNFFRQFNEEIRPLARTYMPVLNSEVPVLANNIGDLAGTFLYAAQRGTAIAAVRKVLTNTSDAAASLSTAVGPVTAAFAKIVTVGAPSISSAGAAFSDAAVRAATFVSKAADTGRLKGWLDGGKDALRDLGAIFGNVGSIIASVFRSANAGGSGLLGNLKQLTGQAAAFLKSGDGGSALTAVFSTLAQLGQAMRTALGAVLPAIATSIRALAPAVGNLAPAFAQLVVAVAPLLPYLTQIAVTVLTRVTPAVAALAGFLQRHAQVLKVVVAAVGAFIVAQKLSTVALVANSAILAVQAAGGLAAYLKGTKLIQAATKLWAGVQWLLNAALTANPIGLVVVAVGALVAAIVIAYKNSDTFRRIVQAAWKGIQIAVAYAWNNVIKPAVAALVSFFRDKIAPAAMWLWNNVIKPAFAGIGFAVKAAWVVIQVALAAFKLYLTNVIFPAVRFLFTNVVKPIFTAIGQAISFWWNNVAKPVFAAAKLVFSAFGAHLKFVWERIVRPVFAALGGYIKNTVAPAFGKGVDLIRAAWEKVRDAAKVPVKFVVNSVLNPLIRGINSAAAFVGVKDRIPTIPGFAAGGRIGGSPSVRDNRLAAGPAGLLKVASGEFITNTRSTSANLPLIQAINAKRGRVSRDDVDPYLDGYTRGGRIGDSIKGFFGRVVNGAKGIGNAILNPKDSLLKLANSALGQVPGGGGIPAMVRAMGSRVINGAGSWLADKIGGGGLGGQSVLGGWKGMENAIHGAFPGLQLISGFRPGSRTLSGNRSYHSLGRAVDFPPIRALAAWIKSKYGSRTKELITPYQDLNLHNGKPHTYTGAIWNQHNFAGGNAHVHWAAQNGGLLGKNSGGMPFGSYDSGGYLPPGLSIAHNGTGRPEPVGHGLAGGNTYNLNVSVPVGAHPAEVGRGVVEAIQAFERSSGSRWRTAKP